MQVSLEKNGSIGRKLNVVVPSAEIETAVAARLKKLSKTVKVQGFRPGKVPMKIVESQYKDRVLHEVASDVIQKTLQQALAKESLVPAAYPDVTPEPIEDGKDFKYTADFDVYPEFKKLDLGGVKIKKPICDIGEKDIDNVIENIRKQNVTWNDVERKSKEGDRVIIDFVGTMDGEEFDGGKANDFPVVLGEGQMLADFEKGLKGVAAGEDTKVNVTFPKDYHGENLAGKKAEFSIKIKSVSEAVLPEIDEELVKKFAIESGKVEDLRSEVEKNLQNNVESQISALTRSRTFDAILDANKTDLPRKMVHQEIGRLIDEHKAKLEQRGIKVDDIPEPNHEDLEPEAKRRVALGLILMEIIRRDSLKADADRVKAKVEKMSASYQEPKEFVDYYYSNKEALNQVESVVLEEQIVENLLESADVKEEKISVNDLLNVPAA